MCGIAGIMERKEATVNPGSIRVMTDAMKHRGPDADGFFTEGEISLGHRRLSIIDLSTAANQPFSDDTNRYVMVFNGEIYNYLEVRSLLVDYPFRTSSDTEVLIAAYARWGIDCLRYFRGMFAFAIWDRQKKDLFIARDRMGVKPLYYYLDEQRLIFASEVRSILATGLVERQADHSALLEYFTFQSVSFPYTMIRNVRQLEAGCWMKVGKGNVDYGRYWDVTDVSKDFDFGDAAGARKRVRQLLLQSVERRLVSDVPVGAFLSGGIDSSAVVGLMAEAGSARPNTFNISFEEKEYDESVYADVIAKKFNTNHSRILLRPTVFLDELENALDALDTPSGDGINTYVVSKAIRQQGMTVALSGVGGDELFGGYPFFRQYLQLRQKAYVWAIPQGLRKFVTGLLPGQARGKMGRMMQLLQAPSCAIYDVYPVFRQILSPALIGELTTLSTGAKGATAVRQELLDRKDRIAGLPMMSQVSVAEYLGYTQHTLLKDTDQMSMAASLEVREPFFDQDLVEFVLAMPDDLKKGNYPKSILVDSLHPLLPDEIVFRKKQGFLFPWDIWLKNDLRGFCERYINNMAQRPFINGDRLQAYWQKFLKGDKDTRWAEVWLFIVLEYWLEKNGIG